MYDVELTTLMIIDEFGEGFPICCIAIKTKCGTLHPKIFMSDITFVYYNEWLNLAHTAI